LEQPTRASRLLAAERPPISGGGRNTRPPLWAADGCLWPPPRRGVLQVPPNAPRAALLAMPSPSDNADVPSWAGITGWWLLYPLPLFGSNPESCLCSSSDTSIAAAGTLLVIAKCIPGSTPWPPPLAVKYEHSLAPFLLLDAGLGALLYVSPGCVFSGSVFRLSAARSWLVTRGSVRMQDGILVGSHRTVSVDLAFRAGLDQRAR